MSGLGIHKRGCGAARIQKADGGSTPAKTARDPDSRINKSLRKWNC